MSTSPRFRVPSGRKMVTSMGSPLDHGFDMDDFEDDYSGTTDVEQSPALVNSEIASGSELGRDEAILEVSGTLSNRTLLTRFS